MSFSDRISAGIEYQLDTAGESVTVTDPSDDSTSTVTMIVTREGFSEADYELGGQTLRRVTLQCLASAVSSPASKNYTVDGLKFRVDEPLTEHGVHTLECERFEHDSSRREGQWLGN